MTLFSYRNDGTLQSVSVPDPAQNNASLVTYSYGFDSLGRATSIRRPDAISALDQSGVNIAYDGVVKTVTEIVGAAGGTPATTKTVNDSFGRLIEVHEQLTVSPTPTYAVTHYSFGPDDIVSTVVDPEGVTTQLQHDLAGHRIQISRHGRTWKFGYDKNGNLISEQVPGSPNPPVTDLNYTTTFAYDDIDRIVSKLIGQRELSAADQQLFGSRSETFVWDYGGNMKGRLYSWLTYAPNSGTPQISRTTWNTDEGSERKRELRIYNVAGWRTHGVTARSSRCRRSWTRFASATRCPEVAATRSPTTLTTPEGCRCRSATPTKAPELEEALWVCRLATSQASSRSERRRPPVR